MIVNKIRKEFVTGGADPTTIVKWTAQCEDGAEIVVTEFQNVYKGYLKKPGSEEVELSDHVAELIHDSMERSYAMQQEMEERDEH